LIVMGIGHDDEVITSDLTFVAPANAIRYVGAYPVFIDADYQTFQMDVDKLDDFLKKCCKKTKKGLLNKKTNRIVKAILPVHILGHCCDMKNVMNIAKEYNLPVIEDATEALGAKFNNKFAGTFGKIGVFSFNGNKIITTGGGGMIVTNSEKIAKKAKYLTTQAKDDAVEFIHNEIGFNYRLPNVLAAMGCAQLENLEKYIEKKNELANIYNLKLSEVNGITTMKEPKNCKSTFWLYTIKVNKKLFGLDRKELMYELEEEKIETRPLWQPMHLLKPHSVSYSHNCENSVRLKKESLSLPCSVGLGFNEQHRVINSIKKRIKK